MSYVRKLLLNQLFITLLYNNKMLLTIFKVIDNLLQKYTIV